MPGRGEASSRAHARVPVFVPRVTVPCRDEDPELFFSTDRFDQAEARTVCASCPVQSECLVASVEQGEAYGTWGGHTYDKPRGKPGPAPGFVYDKPPVRDPGLCRKGLHPLTYTALKRRKDGKAYKICGECRRESNRKSQKRNAKCQEGHPLVGENRVVLPGFKRVRCGVCLALKDPWTAVRLVS